MLIYIFSFLIVLTIVVVFHEYGHYTIAKRSGMKVLDFAVGFGPRLFSWKKNGTTFSVNLLPLGGFVNIHGLGDDNSLKPANAVDVNDPETFQSKPLLHRMATILAGPFMNLVLAVVIFFLIFSIFGIPTDLTNEIETIIPHSPAESVGLKPGDKLLTLNGKTIVSMEKTIQNIHKSKGILLTLTIERRGEIIPIKVKPKWDPENKVALIGFSPKVAIKKLSIQQAIVMSLEQTWEGTIAILWFLGQLITGKASLGNLMGVVGIAHITGQVAQKGVVPLLNLMALLSINLGVVNILPLPALDGGRFVFLLIELVKGSPINQKKENLIHYVGFSLLLILMVLLTINDLKRILGFKIF